VHELSGVSGEGREEMIKTLARIVQASRVKADEAARAQLREESQDGGPGRS